MYEPKGTRQSQRGSTPPRIGERAHGTASAITSRIMARRRRSIMIASCHNSGGLAECFSFNVELRA